MKLCHVLGYGFSVISMIACSGAGPSGTDTTSGAATADTAIAVWTFKLYHPPDFASDPSCDRFTSLVLSADPARAHLENELGGTCEIFVPPQPRDYILRLQSNDSCGTKIYAGTSRTGGVSRTIKITDHRARVC